MNSNKKTIMIIDDHPIIHDGLKTLLANEADLEITRTASSASEAIKILKTGLPDIAIVDLSLGDSDGTYLIQRLRKKYTKLRILVYTMSEEKLFAERAATAGANGYVMKTSPPSELKKAIRRLLNDEISFDDATTQRIKKKKSGRSKGKKNLLDPLSNREMDIFKLVGQGSNSIAISEKLGISRNTVDTHRINIKNKLELANGKALDRFAYEVLQKGVMPD